MTRSNVVKKKKKRRKKRKRKKKKRGRKILGRGKTSGDIYQFVLVGTPYTVTTAIESTRNHNNDKYYYYCYRANKCLATTAGAIREYTR
jgi:hypothetical protein